MQWNRLYQGDCIEGLSQVEPESVDLAFADPPFNIGYQYDVYEDRHDYKQYLAWTRQWGQAVRRVLKPHGTFWLAIGDEYAAELKLLFQNELGFCCRSWVIWYYTFGVHCTKKFSRSHAHLFYFVKDPKQFTFNGLDIRVPSARQLVYADSRADSRGRVPDDTWILRPQDLPDGFQPDEDTWYFRRVCGTFKERAGWHGCQMPEQLLGRIIRACSTKDDLVLDPFAGSGTTLAVAKKLGRRWLGFELSPNYKERVEARLGVAKEGQPLEGAEDPRASAPRTPARNGEALSPTSAVIAPETRDAAATTRAIIEAFFTVRDGFPADRVVADPDLNGRFVQTCRRFGVPGRPCDWNFRLLNLRKAGHFSGLPRSKKTSLAPDEVDRFAYACEIAVQHLCERGLSLDHALCDPEAAAEYDRYVQSMISERADPFMIRWIAFRIRKRAKKNRELARGLESSVALPKQGWSLSGLQAGDLPASPGLYWLQSPDRRLYVGETLDLRRRFQLQFEAPGFDFWKTDREHLDLRYRALPDGGETLLKGNQSRWIARWNPVGNYSGFAAQ